MKQKAYMQRKYEELEHIFLSEPKPLKRKHPLSQRTYQYVRLQGYTSSYLGEIRQQFYDSKGKKRLPDELDDMLVSSLTVAVWYMDDGYYYERDKSAHIYLQKFEPDEIQQLIDVFKNQHGIECKAYCRPDRKSCQLNFRKSEAMKLALLVEPHLISEMRYKLPLDPVTTEQ